MAIGVSGNGGRRSRDLPAISEINVTPFVDVALVLLLIFMITAHAMESGIDVEVPKTRTTTVTTKELPVVSVTKAGNIYLGKSPININELGATIHSRYPGQTAVYLKTDREATMEYGVQVMSALKDAKLDISIVTQFDDTRK